MIYLVYGFIESERAVVVAQYYNPWEGLEEMHGPGIFVESIPEPQTQEGFSAVLMVKLPAEGSDDEPELYYDYRALPEPEETQLEKAQNRITTLEAADLDNKEMIATLYELTLMGGM